MYPNGVYGRGSKPTSLALGNDINYIASQLCATLNSSSMQCRLTYLGVHNTEIARDLLLGYYYTSSLTKKRITANAMMTLTYSKIMKNHFDNLPCK